METLSASSTPTAELPGIRILDLPVHNVDMQTALDTIDGFICAGTPHHIVTADASMLVMAQQDETLRRIIRRAEMITPDSVGVLWAARRQGAPIRERVSGVEIVERLCALSPARGYRLYFLGAGPGVAEQAAERMRARYPGAIIVGARHGFFSEHDTSAILDEIRTCRPDVLCVALGIPKQEKWIAQYRDQLDVPVLIGVGGTLDVLSGTVRRAPRLFQRARLEWLWRLISNPRKISKVMLLPSFVMLVRRAGRTNGL